MIEVKGLYKSFNSIKAVDTLSFESSSGEIFGLLGPNGAGKTTTLRIMATLLQADSGTVTINGLEVKEHPEEVRRMIGVVNGGMGLYDRLTGLEVLQYFGGFYGMSKAAVNQRVKQLDDLLHLGGTLKRYCGSFSTGMKQKIVIARAVLHDPSVIFFDEATSGLDVMACRAVLDFVKQYSEGKRTVIYSTHIMSEVEELCQRAAVIYGGKLIANSTIADLLGQTQTKTLERAFFALIENVRENVKQHPEVTR
ncbi:MAG: ABC transporter ATP-binding protein [Trueperaceae bacterium]